MNGPQPPLSDPALAQDYAGAGFFGDNLVTMVAVALAESGGDPDVYGDESLQNATWGPSVGLSQIRSLRTETGRGGPRDVTKLTDPVFNARAAWTISGGGTNFSPWSTWTSGRFRQYLDRARAAVAGRAAAGTVPGATGGLQGLSAASLGGGLVDKIVSPLLSGLARLSLVALAVAGGVGLVVAGAYRGSSTVRRAADTVDAGARKGVAAGALVA